MASSSSPQGAENPPIDISDEASDSSQDSDFEAKMTERACDREEAETAYANAIVKAKENLVRFKKQAEQEAELDRLARTLKKKEKLVRKKGKAARKSIGGAGDTSVCGETKQTSSLNRDQQFAVAANKVAMHVLNYMVSEGVVDGPVVDTLNALANDDPPAVRCSNHEEELLRACIPEQLRNNAFEDGGAPFPEYERPTGDDAGTVEHLIQAVETMYKGLAAVNRKVEQVARVQQIHTLAHLANIRATGLLGVNCLKDGERKDKVHTNLIVSMKSVILGSDPELEDLPFRSSSVIDAFFKDINRIIKLAHFLLAFVEFDRFYASRLLDTVFHMQFQRTLYWKSGTGNNGCVFCVFSDKGFVLVQIYDIIPILESSRPMPFTYLAT